jgi:prolyl oligopeptidase
LQYELCTSLESSPQTNPLIARIDTKAGHGAGRPTQKVVSIFYWASCFERDDQSQHWLLAQGLSLFEDAAVCI